jgi:hypothetical protein
MTPRENDRLYDEDQNFYQDEFGERISREDNLADDNTEEIVPDESMADDQTETAEGATAPSQNYESDFHESLDATDQIGDQRLMDEAESDYPADGNGAASGSDTTASGSDTGGHSEGLGDKIRDKFEDITSGNRNKT